jgi:hypothetical protein
MWNDSYLYQDDNPWQLAGWGNLTASYDVQWYYNTTVVVRLQDSQPFHFLDTESGSTSAEVLADVDPGATYYIISELFVDVATVGTYPDGQYYDIFAFWWYGGANYGDWYYDYTLNRPDICVEEESFYMGNLIAEVDMPPHIDSISPNKGSRDAGVGVTISGDGFGTGATINVGSGITVSVVSATDTYIQATFTIASSAAAGNRSITVTDSKNVSSNGINFFVQVPSSLSIVSDTDSTGSESSCDADTGCGVTRTFTYQVNDQSGQPIQASLPLWDAITITSPNNLSISTMNTTCSPSNTGPCDVFTFSNGRFGESLPVCSPVCKVNNTCTTGGPTNASQTWHIGSSQISKSLSYYCDHVVVQ